MERWTYDVAEEGGASDLAAMPMRLLAFTRKAGRMETVFLIRDYCWRLFLGFVMTGKDISEREKELYRSVFFGIFYLLCGHCVFRVSSFCF